MATSTSHTIRFSHDLQVNKSRSITITRLLSGTLEMSALYRFQFLVEVTWPPNTTGTDCSASIATLLGQRVHVTAIAADATADAQGSGKPATVEEKAFQHIHGIIMSIESTTAYGKVEQSKSTYILTVSKLRGTPHQPRQTMEHRACPLRRRRKATSPISPTETKRRKRLQLSRPHSRILRSRLLLGHAGFQQSNADQ